MAAKKKVEEVTEKVKTTAKKVAKKTKEKADKATKVTKEKHSATIKKEAQEMKEAEKELLKKRKFFLRQFGEWLLAILKSVWTFLKEFFTD